ncbi:MAG: TetR/AcrR family transcriptional regulator [Sandaracinaceae bacterium]
MIHVMGERGYARASVASVAQHAGLTTGLLHYHFKSKEEILLAVIDRLGDVVQARFESRLAEAETALEQLRAFLDAHLEMGPDANPAAVACWVALGTEALARGPVFEAYGRFMQAHHRALTELAEQVLREAGRPPERAPLIASALLAAIEGTLRLAVIAPGVIVEGTAAGLLRDMASGLFEGGS